jgi:hypothetical protein
MKTCRLFRFVARAQEEFSLLWSNGSVVPSGETLHCLPLLLVWYQADKHCISCLCRWYGTRQGNTALPAPAAGMVPGRETLHCLPLPLVWYQAEKHCSVGSSVAGITDTEVQPARFCLSLPCTTTVRSTALLSRAHSTEEKLRLEIF